MTLMTIVGSTPTRVATPTTAEKQSFFLAGRARPTRSEFGIINNPGNYFEQNFVQHSQLTFPVMCDRIMSSKGTNPGKEMKYYENSHC